jgi:SAM-dependent methyltransferase
VGIKQARLILDVGCGTGVILDELVHKYTTSPHGLDINPKYLDIAKRKLVKISLTQGDAHHLPFKNQQFDATICHFLLMWVSDPLQVVEEMARVTRPGGAVLALAEPDYGGRIDHPAELEELGRLQTEALHAQGADSFMGRRLAGLFIKTGFSEVETGVLGGQWIHQSSKDSIESEWSVLSSDLEFLNVDEDDIFIDELKNLDAAAWAKGERVLFVPTFYALGRL